MFQIKNSYPSWANLVQKIAIASLSWKFEYVEFNSDVHFSYIRPEVDFFLEIYSKNQNFNM